MKILLLGKGGQVGWELQRSLAPLGELVALEFDSTDYCGDFTNLAGLAETVRKVKPDVIVNAAAHTAVDRAESEPELAQAINAVAPGLVDTPLTETWTAARQLWNEKSPMKRGAKPEDIAQVVAMLVASDYVTGEVVLSGSLGIMVPVQAGDNLRVTIGGIGGCSVRFV